MVFCTSLSILPTKAGNYDNYWLLNGVRYLYPIPGGVPKEAGGNDDYFNNSVYLFGWTLHQMTIGTPLITSPIILSGNKQTLIDGHSVDYILNNKVTGHHLGVEGTYKNLSYKIFYTWYLNFGTNNLPFNPIIPQQSFLLQTYLKNKLPWGLDLSVKSGIDIGKMYGNNLGFQVSLIKKG